MDEDRSGELSSVIVKGLGALVAFALVVAVGTWAVVHLLGLNGGGSGEATVQAHQTPVTPLPTTALPNTQSGNDQQGGGSDATSGTPAAGSTKSHHHHHARSLQLSMSPLQAQPMQRVNLTGTYRGHDNTALQVQRLEGGSWSDFPTQADVQMGTFQTYVMTGRPGANRFRVLDPSTGKASNVVTVTIN